MPMLRQDAEVTLFVLKHKQADGRWVNSSLDYFGFAGPDGNIARTEARAAFEASGQCWQRYGIHGCLDEATGMQALQEITRANPCHEFGLFEVKLVQQTRTVATAKKAPADWAAA